MPPDAEKLRPARGEDGVQVNVRVSSGVAEIIDVLRFLGSDPGKGVSSRAEFVLEALGRVIEADAPGLRDDLAGLPGDPDKHPRFGPALTALDELVPEPGTPS